MATFTAQVPSRAGATLTYTAVAASDLIPNSGGKTLLHVKNGGGVSTNVTFTGRGSIGDLTVPDRVVAIPAGQDRVFLLDAALYNDSSGYVTVSYSATASVTAAAIYLP